MDVACLLIADFLVAIARRDNPLLRGRPVVIGGAPEEHAAVRACSREALREGVTIGTTLRKALSLCPNAVFLPFREAQAREEAAAIFDLVAGYSPVVEEVAPGHLHFETAGLARLAKLDEETWLAEVQESVAGRSGLPVALAGAPSVFAAHAAATTLAGKDGGASIVVAEAATAEFLAGLPVEALPVEPAIHQRLRLFGLTRLGEVAALPFSAMQAQFGKPGARAWELANGKDDARIIPARDEVRLTEAVRPACAGGHARADRHRHEGAAAAGAGPAGGARPLAAAAGLAADPGERRGARPPGGLSRTDERPGTDGLRPAGEDRAAAAAGGGRGAGGHALGVVQ